MTVLHYRTYASRQEWRIIAMEMDTLYAYLAGAVDADGFITVYRKLGPKRRDGHRPTYYVAKIGLSETNPTIPDLLYATFGGWRGEHQPANPKHKRWHIWQATNDKAAQALRQLVPHLRLKKQQAVYALQFCELVKSQQVEVWSQNRQAISLTPEQEAARAAIWAAVTKLNDPRNRRLHFLEAPLSETPGATP